MSASRPRLMCALSEQWINHPARLKKKGYSVTNSRFNQVNAMLPILYQFLFPAEPQGDRQARVPMVNNVHRRTHLQGEHEYR